MIDETDGEKQDGEEAAVVQPVERVGPAPAAAEPTGVEDQVAEPEEDEDDAPAPAAGPAPASAAPDLKLVLTLTPGKATLGVQAPGCDPVLVRMDRHGEPPLEETLGLIPALVEIARRKWREGAKNTAYNRPVAPPAAAKPARTTRQAPAAPASIK